MGKQVPDSDFPVGRGTCPCCVGIPESLQNLWILEFWDKFRNGIIE